MRRLRVGWGDSSASAGSRCAPTVSTLGVGNKTGWPDKCPTSPLRSTDSLHYSGCSLAKHRHLAETTEESSVVAADPACCPLICGKRRNAVRSAYEWGCPQMGRLGAGGVKNSRGGIDKQYVQRLGGRGGCEATPEPDFGLRFQWVRLELGLHGSKPVRPMGSEPPAGKQGIRPAT